MGVFSGCCPSHPCERCSSKPGCSEVACQFRHHICLRPPPLLVCRYWLSVGAQPSDRVSYLLTRIGLIPKPPQAPKFGPPPGKAADPKKKKK